MIQRCGLRENFEFDKKDILNSFAKKIPYIRKELHMSQTDLGEKLGMSRQSISSIERKIVPLTWDTFLALLMVIMISDEEMYKNLTADKELEGVIEELKRS